MEILNPKCFSPQNSKILKFKSQNPQATRKTHLTLCIISWLKFEPAVHMAPTRNQCPTRARNAPAATTGGCRFTTGKKNASSQNSAQLASRAPVYSLLWFRTNADGFDCRIVFFPRSFGFGSVRFSVRFGFRAIRFPSDSVFERLGFRANRFSNDSVCERFGFRRFGFRRFGFRAGRFPSDSIRLSRAVRFISVRVTFDVDFKSDAQYSE